VAESNATEGEDELQELLREVAAPDDYQNLSAWSDTNKGRVSLLPLSIEKPQKTSHSLWPRPRVIKEKAAEDGAKAVKARLDVSNVKVKQHATKAVKPQPHASKESSKEDTAKAVKPRANVSNEKSKEDTAKAVQPRPHASEMVKKDVAKVVKLVEKEEKEAMKKGDEAIKTSIKHSVRLALKAGKVASHIGIGCEIDVVPGCPYIPAVAFPLHALAYAKLRPAEALAVKILPDGEHVLSSDGNGIGWIWNIASGKPEVALRGLTGAVRALLAFEDNTHVALGDATGRALVFKWRSGLPVKAIKWCGPLSSMVEFPQFGISAVGDGDQTRLWNFRNGESVIVDSDLVDREEWARKVRDRLLRDIQVLYSGAPSIERYALQKEANRLEDAVEKALDRARKYTDTIPTGNCKPGRFGNVNAIAYFPPQDRFATAHDDGNIRIWSATSGRLLRVLHGHHGPVLALWPLPELLTLYSGGMDGTIRRWNVPLGQQNLLIWAGFGGAVRALTVIPGGPVYSGHDDGFLRVWEAVTGLPICKQNIFGGRVNDVVYNPRTLTEILTATEDGWVRVWKLR